MKIVNLITREPVAETRTKDLAAAITAAGGEFYFPVPDNEPDVLVNNEWYYSEDLAIITEKEFKRGEF